MEEKHTPTPWKWMPGEGQFIVAPDGTIVAEIPCQGANPADGEFIARAVNAHEDLMTALERIKDLSDYWCSDSTLHTLLKVINAKADAALSKAKEQP